MPVYKQGSEWTVRISKTENGKRFQTTKRHFATKREAQQWEAQYIRQSLTPTSDTFEDMLERYLAWSDASDTAKYLKRSFAEHHFPLRSKRISNISKEDLIDWRNGLRESGLATRTINRGMGYVRSVFNYASEVYGIPNNATVLKSFKLTKQDKEEMQVWSPEEFARFIDAVPEGYYKAYFQFLYWTGCRRSEALAVCKDDFTGNHVRIWRSIKHYKNGFLPLKTDSSERTIALDSHLMAVLAPYIADADPFVFGGIRSLPITNVQREFAKGIEASGVKPIRIHDLRHSHASNLIAAGVPVLAVSKRLGHSSVTITLNTYSHLLEKTDEEMLDVIEKLQEKGSKRVQR